MNRTTAIFLALLSMAGPAQAVTVSPKVGPVLREAQALIAAKDFKGAVAKLEEAEAVKSNAVDDETVIKQMRHVIALASSQPPQP